MSSIDYAYFFGLACKFGIEVIDYRGRHTHPQRRWSMREVEDIKGFVIHQTAGGDNVDALGRYHTGKLPGGVHIGDGKGLPGIAYTLFVNKKGEVFLVNDIEAITWSHGDATIPGDENKLYMSACFGGKFRARGWSEGKEQPSSAQVDVFHKLWACMKEGFHLTDLDLYGHYDFGKDTCPGDDLRRLIETYNSKVRYELKSVAAQQQALVDLGYEPGPADGVWGTKTRAALQSFQRDHFLPVTRSWTKLTTHHVYRELERKKA